MPSSFVTNDALSITAAVATGKTVTGSGVVTVSDAILSTQAFSGLPSGTVFSLGGVASATAMPSSFVTNAALSITAAIANGKTITGSGVVTVSDAILSAQTFGNLPSGTVFSLGGVASATAMPSSFVTNAALSITAAIANGKTITGSGDVTVSAMASNTDLSGISVSGIKTAQFSASVTYVASLSGWVVTVAAIFTLTISATYISGVSVSGAGSVTVTTMAADTNLANITVSGTKTAQFSADVTYVASLSGWAVTVINSLNLTVSAAYISGVSVSGDGYVTVSTAIATTQSFSGLPEGTVFSLGGVADTAMPTTFVTNAALSITASVANNKTITGSGIVTVSTAISSTQNFTDLPNGTVFSLGGVADTAMPTSFVTNDALSITAVVASGKTITGSGSITVNSKLAGTQDFSGLPNGTDFTGGSGNASASFNGNLPASFIFGGIVTYYVTVVSVVGKTITGSGNIIITNWAGVTTGDFSNIDVSNLTYTIDSNVSAFSGKLKNSSNVINLNVKTSISFTIAHNDIIEVSSYGISGLPAIIVTKIGAGTLTLLYIDGTRVVFDASTNNPYFTDTRLSTLLTLPSNTEYRLTKSNGTIQIDIV
jgi:hypothetical protein